MNSAVAKEIEHRRRLRSDDILFRYNIQLKTFQANERIVKIFSCKIMDGKSLILAESINDIKFCLREYERHLQRCSVCRNMSDI